MSRSPWDVNRLLILSGALLTLAAIVLMLSIGSEASMLAPFAVGIVAALVLAFYSPAWMYLVAGLLGAAFPLVVVFVFGAREAITHPGSGVEGMAVMLILAGAILALIGGIAGFVQARRGRAPAAREALRAPQGVLAITVVALFAGLMLSSSWVAADYAHAADAPASLVTPDETIELLAKDFAFAPKEVVLPAGKLVALRIMNEDGAVHTFSYHYDGKTRDAVIPANSAITLHFKLDTAETIHFWCAPHSGGASDDGTGMVGEMVVQ